MKITKLLDIVKSRKISLYKFDLLRYYQIKLKKSKHNNEHLITRVSTLSRTCFAIFQDLAVIIVLNINVTQYLKYLFDTVLLITRYKVCVLSKILLKKS